MRPMSAGQRVFWRSDTCTVWVGYDDAGRLVFGGEDREYLDEHGIDNDFNCY